MFAFTAIRPLTRSLLLLSVAANLAAAGCGSPPETAAAPAESYALRGEIVRLPAAGSRDIVLRHEAVPEFRDDTGKVVGMEAMTMPFTLAPDVTIAGLAPGDRIAFTLEMRWQDPREVARISRIEKLPSGATLSWDPPPAGAPVAGPAPEAAGSPPR